MYSLLRMMPCMSLQRKVLLGVGLAVTIWLVLCAVAGIIAAEGVLHPARRALTQSDEARATEIAENHHAALEQVEISADDGTVLRAWYIHLADGNGDAVIMLHGQAGNRAGLLGPADLMLRYGYAVLLPDARGQGTSDGEFATYGIKEASDIWLWSKWLAQAQAPRCIDALGESMGAAQLLESLKMEPGFCAVIAESSFANFREASYDRIGEWFDAGPWLGRTVLRPVVEFGLIYASLKYGVELSQDDPDQTVAASHIPVLLIDGLLDNNLPPYNSEMILAESRGRNPNVVLWEPPDAGHCGAFAAEPAEFERRVIIWFQDHQVFSRM